MKTSYQYITFSEDSFKYGHYTYTCRNKKSGYELGTVMWYVPWKQWCYFPTQPAVYSAGCLNDINDFIGQLK